jgi:hypothetical protein
MCTEKEEREKTRAKIECLCCVFVTLFGWPGRLPSMPLGGEKIWASGPPFSPNLISFSSVLLSFPGHRSFKSIFKAMMKRTGWVQRRASSRA